MFSLQFLLEQIDERDTIMRSFIEHMLVSLMDNYSDTSAKGGDHAQDINLDEQTKQKFEEKDDQSMVSHLLNGIFPTLRLLAILESEALLVQPFTEVERRVYILSYLMHDVDKIITHEARQGGESITVATRTREEIECTKTVIAQRLIQCNVKAFFPEYATYLEEIAYLVVNTQQKWGTHLPTFLWRFQLAEIRVYWLRDLCTYSDKLAYLIPSPSAILLSDEAKALTSILAGLSNDELVFYYHQFREVRGLLTSVQNNALIELFTQSRDGIWPYLFFSDGVVYLKRKAVSIHITTEQIVEAVQARLKAICADAIKNEAPGLKFSIQGVVKHPGYYYEFLSLEDYLALLATFTLRRTNNDITSGPLGKLRQMQANGEISGELTTDFSPDKRIGMLSRFFSTVFTTLPDMLGKKQQVLREHLEQELVKHLGLSPYWEQAKTIPGKGGVEYRWFWLGACYLHAHPGLHEYDGEQNLLAIFNAAFDLVIKIAGEELRKQMPQRYLLHLTRYLDSVVEVPLASHESSALPDFQAEIERYTGSKSKGRKLLCTLCNSAYPAEEQTDTAVLFQPWVYKNKLPLYAGKNAGGICAICSLELMLRQILQKGQLRLTGSKFEARKTKYLVIYPNFFFTAETGAMVSGILDQLHAVNFFTVRRQLEGNDITVKTLLNLEVFAASTLHNEELQPRVFLHDEYEDDAESDEDVEESESVVQSSINERGYLKFKQDHYPDLFLFGMQAGKDDNDTASWAMPAFLALTLPLVTNTKLVISELSLPLFSSGRDFRETIVFDAPHPYLDRLLGVKRLRVNQLLTTLKKLVGVYRVNIDTYAKQGKPEWKHLSGIVRNLETDPLYLFSYLRKQQRTESLYTSSADGYIHMYKKVLGADLSKIQHCVDNYAAFYRGSYQSHSILKPVDIVAKAIINSPLNIDPDDLLWQIRGELKSWLDRVRNRHATGYAVFWGKDIETQEVPALERFVTGFYQEVFLDYCQGERGLLRSRINRFKDGCEAYYISEWKQKSIKGQERELELVLEGE